jgi:hypothetical protein
MSYQADAQEALEEYVEGMLSCPSRKSYLFNLDGGSVLIEVEDAFKAGYNAALGITEVCDD